MSIVITFRNAVRDTPQYLAFDQRAYDTAQARYICSSQASVEEKNTTIRGGEIMENAKARS